MVVLIYSMFPPVTKKQLWRFSLNEPHICLGVSIFYFFKLPFGFLQVNLLLVQSHLAEKNLMKHHVAFLYLPSLRLAKDTLLGNNHISF